VSAEVGEDHRGCRTDARSQGPRAASPCDGRTGVPLRDPAGVVPPGRHPPHLTWSHGRPVHVPPVGRQHPRIARCLPLPGRRRPGDLRGQGQEPPPAAEQLLRRRGGPAPAHPADGDDGVERRLDRRRHRGRGPPAGVQLDQGVRPALQRPLPRRQELPTPGRSARPSTRSPGSSRHAPARPASSSAPARSAAPACSATSASAPPRASAGSAPRSTGRSSTTSATSWPARPSR
jgi:hypothetical protein